VNGVQTGDIGCMAPSLRVPEAVPWPVMGRHQQNDDRRALG